MSDQITNSQPYNELQKVLKSFSSNISNKKEEVGGSCVKEAEAEVAATMMELRQHKASGGGGESATPPVSAATPSIVTTSADLTEAKGGEDFSLLNDDAPMPQTLDEAMDHINKLKTMRDSLLEEKNRNDKFVERYKAKVDKQERMATLHHIIPRQLFVREDRYNEELEKVYKWSGISDQEIADIYRRKLGDIKQHGASINIRDPYRNFREIPDFSKVNGKNASSYSSHNSVLRDLKFMKKIAGGNN